MQNALLFVGTLLGGGVIGAALTALVSLRELRLKRVLESTTLFLTVQAAAHGYRLPDHSAIGLGEQVAAVRLLGMLGKEYKPLREPARDFLARYDATSFGEHTNVLREAARRALADMPGGWRHRPPQTELQP